MAVNVLIVHLRPKGTSQASTSLTDKHINTHFLRTFCNLLYKDPRLSAVLKHHQYLRLPQVEVAAGGPVLDVRSYRIQHYAYNIPMGLTHTHSV